MADRDWLEANCEFHPLDYEDVYSRNNRPKLDQYDDYVFIVLHFPLFDKDQGRVLTAELDLFMGPDYLITLPNIPLPPLTAMFERYREKDDLRKATLSKGSGYLLYKIVDTCVDASFPMLRKMVLKLDRIEDDIFEGRSSEIVRDISEAKQEIINFRRIVRPQRAVLRDLERTKQRYLQEELEIYFDDISDAAERIWDTLENYKEVIEALESTNESVLSHRLNDSFRILLGLGLGLGLGARHDRQGGVGGDGAVEALLGSLDVHPRAEVLAVPLDDDHLAVELDADRPDLDPECAQERVVVDLLERLDAGDASADRRNVHEEVPGLVRGRLNHDLLIENHPHRSMSTSIAHGSVLCHR